MNDVLDEINDALSIHVETTPTTFFLATWNCGVTCLLGHEGESRFVIDVFLSPKRQRKECNKTWELMWPVRMNYYFSLSFQHSFHVRRVHEISSVFICMYIILIICICCRFALFWRSLPLLLDLSCSFHISATRSGSFLYFLKQINNLIYNFLRLRISLLLICETTNAMKPHPARQRHLQLRPYRSHWAHLTQEGATNENLYGGGLLLL